MFSYNKFGLVVVDGAWTQSRLRLPLREQP